MFVLVTIIRMIILCIFLRFIWFSIAFQSNEVFCFGFVYYYFITFQTAVAQLWDTAGQEGFERIRILSYENTNIFILCFSCADWVTFNNVDTKWLDEIRKNRPEAKILLVGTKSDLRSKAGDRGSRLSNKGRSMRQKEVAILELEIL